MISRGVLAIVALSIASALVSCAAQAPDSFAPAPAPGAGLEAPAAGAPVPPDPDPWPRQIQLSNATLTVYQPQVESWQGNQFSFRAAVAAKASGANAGTFGVVWGSARTEVDRVVRRVTLEDLRLTRSNFPTLPDKGAAYLSELQQQSQGAVRTIALDSLEASLAASATVAATAGPEGAGRAAQTTTYNARTGQSNTFGTASVDNHHYADANGNVYKNTGSGWQQHTSNGWQAAGGDTSWADREQQARSIGQDRFSNFQSGGWGERLGGGGDGGGFGDRFGEGGRFGGFGGGRFGGFRGGRR